MTEPSDLCVRCQYDLRGIANDQPCPECGLLAERSRHLDGRLRDNTPAYLRKLSVGTWLTLLAVVLPFPLLVIQLMVTHGMRRSLFGPWPYVRHEPLIPFAVGAILLIAGVWMLTANDTRSGRRRTVRTLARTTAFAPLLLIACAVAHGELESTRLPSMLAVSDAPGESMRLAVLVLGGVVIVLGILPLPVLVFSHLRHLGKRLLSRQIAEHSTIVGIGISTTIMVILLRYVAAYATEGTDFGMHRRTLSNVWLGIHVAVLTLSLLFVLWTLFLLIRFAIAFLIESHALRKLWREADRSGVTSPPG